MLGMQVITVDTPMWIKHGKMERHFNVKWSSNENETEVRNRKLRELEQ